MQIHDPLLDQVILDAHTVISRVDILSRGVVIASDVPVSSGTLVQDRSQWTRRSCTLTIADSTLGPTKSTDLLAPYGNEVRVYRGVIAPNGSSLLVCQGTYGIQDAEVDYINGGVKLSCLDRGARVSAARFPYARYLGDSTAMGAMRTLITETTPWVGVGMLPGVIDRAIAGQSWDRDRDKAVINLAASIGAECYCEPYGDFVVGNIPNPLGAPVWSVASTNALVEPSRKLSRQNVYNSVVASGTSSPPATSSTVDGVTPAASDFQPTSPTYIYGPFGASTTFFASPFITTTNGADSAAQGILRDNLGLSRAVTFSSVVNPALEAGDIVGVDFGGGLVEYHLLDRIETPLGAGPMKASTRTTSYQLGA